MRNLAAFAVIALASAGLCSCSAASEDSPVTGAETGNSGTVGVTDLPGQAGGGGGANVVDPPAPSKTNLDPGRVAIRRLSNFEYNNTVQDLLGTALRPADTFLREQSLGFDNVATSLGVTPQQYESYFNAAEALVSDLVASPERFTGILSCVPAAPDDTSCAEGIVNALGSKVWRRPLAADEVTLLLKVYQDAITLGEDHAGAIAQVTRTLLGSAQFLYRVEFDPDPNSIAVHPLNSYELASRLSYLLWSSAPDAELFSLAAADGLNSTDAVLAQVERMLADGKASRFIHSFAGQWLGFQNLATQHAVATDTFPTWTETLRTAMVEEQKAFFAEFLSTERPWNEFFTFDVNYVDAELATLYQMPAATGRVEFTTDERRGFLGLAGFLTMSSYDYRTSPVLRARHILTDLLCSPPPPPPANVPTLEEELSAEAANQAAKIENVRERLELHRTNPQCAGCHQTLDPFGLGLEKYDAIGAYRTAYSNGDPIRADATLPDGTPFDGLVELSTILSQDPRFLNCSSKKLFVYATGRGDEPTDAEYFTEIQERWSGAGFTLRALIDSVVMSDTFRFRRGEVAAQ